MSSNFITSSTCEPSAGKVMLTVIWDSEGVLLTHFRISGENVNCVFYYEVMLKLQDASYRKPPWQQARGIPHHHDNVRPHTARATQERIKKLLQLELLEHPPYSP